MADLKWKGGAGIELALRVWDWRSGEHHVASTVDIVDCLNANPDARGEALSKLNPCGEWTTWRTRATAAESESADLRAENEKLRADATRALEQMADSEHALLSLREAIDEHLPHYEPEHEAGDYEAVVRIAGKEIDKLSGSEVDELRAERDMLRYTAQQAGAALVRMASPEIVAIGCTLQDAARRALGGE